MALRLPQLKPDSLWFPPLSAALAEPNGLLAFGGDLRPERILAAYRRGIFPWYQDDQPILWWSPDPRAVLFPNQVHISRSMRKMLKHSDIEIRTDTDFDAVIAACAEITATRDGTWITPEMQLAYSELHRLGYAHSIEAWQGESLVGGLYGIAMGSVFFGESMFSREKNASKVALIRLCEQLQRWGFAVIDCQVGNDHTRSMGAVTIERSAFLQLLDMYAERGSVVPNSAWRFEGTAETKD